MLGHSVNATLQCKCPRSCQGAIGALAPSQRRCTAKLVGGALTKNAALKDLAATGHQDTPPHAQAIHIVLLARNLDEEGTGVVTGGLVVRVVRAIAVRKLLALPAALGARACGARSKLQLRLALGDGWGSGAVEGNGAHRQMASCSPSHSAEFTTFTPRPIPSAAPSLSPLHRGGGEDIIVAETRTTSPAMTPRTMVSGISSSMSIDMVAGGAWVRRGNPTILASSLATCSPLLGAAMGVG
eukprot:CAMPEP_0118863978 /NCGR_PEP_ID=MMETSP1163-20130328/8669_1 /TAXON_ID=124430 /ORGANISM="Phaeomonas parva, Strain CCMP2877" /LENGTH=240 /DNA_ID=CAMNT_0006798037 /DNA_START=303 /DNA_END=1022 /DNA_ORIENTATION=+